jgi:8-oxo-dGTP diphosphatase
MSGMHGRSGARPVRVGAYALTIDDAGRILLCRVSPSIVSGQVWTLPGGGLDYGESPEAGVLRELTEESGYQGEIERLVDASSRVYSDTEVEGGGLHAVRIVYRVRITGGELRDEVDGSTDTCAWFTPRQAARLHLGDLARRMLAMATVDTPGSAAASATTVPDA